MSCASDMPIFRESSVRRQTFLSSTLENQLYWQEPDNKQANTAVIWHLSSTPDISTVFVPLFSIVHYADGVIFMAVWSQLSRSSFGMSSIFTTVFMRYKNCCLIPVK